MGQTTTECNSEWVFHALVSYVYMFCITRIH